MEEGRGTRGEDMDVAGGKVMGLGVYHFIIRGLPLRVEPPLTTWGMQGGETESTPTLALHVHTYGFHVNGLYSGDRRLCPEAETTT